MSTAPSKAFESAGAVAERLYRAGGLLLVLAAAGIVALLLGSAADGAARLVLAGIGGVLLMGCLAVYAFARAQGRELRSMAARISGWWWERITQDEASALSLFEIRENPFTCTVELEGEAWDRDGNPRARWKSEGSCLSLVQQKLFYFWTGAHPGKSADRWEGYGEITFPGVDEEASRGHGFFFDACVSKEGVICKKSFELARCSAADLTVMQGAEAAARRTLILQRLQQLA
jgi:hypothetical protein